MSKFSHCSACGTKYQEEVWPRVCTGCGDIHWKNPIPVVCVIQPVWDHTPERKGVMIAKRAIQPCFGGWALVGGYMDQTDESIFAAARREFLEETGMPLRGNLVVVDSHTNNNGNLIITVLTDWVYHVGVLEAVKLCHENSEIGVSWADDPVDLCFPIHDRVVKTYLLTLN